MMKTSAVLSIFVAFALIFLVSPMESDAKSRLDSEDQVAGQGLTTSRKMKDDQLQHKNNANSVDHHKINNNHHGTTRPPLPPHSNDDDHLDYIYS